MNDIERACYALNHLDPSCSREDWVRIGMAAKSAGLSFNEFHEWSKKGANYENEKGCRTVWRSFDESGGIGAATLFYMAREKGWSSKTIPNTERGEYDKNQSNHQEGKEDKTHDIKADVNAFKVWERCLPVDSSHEYIQRKQGIPHGLRYYPETEEPLIISGKDVRGYLAVPCWSNDELQTIQFIPTNKGDKKLNLPDASFNDGYFTVGVITDLIYLVEGVGHAWAIHKARGATAIVCFGMGRMMKVAKVLREKYPNVRIIIVPDRGKELQASDIAVAINGQWFKLPQDKLENYDVNDYAKEYGYEALTNLLADIKIPELRYKLLSINEVYNSPHMNWIVKGIIPKVGLAALYGPSGSGKSFLLLDLALTIATGEAFWFGRRINAVPIIYVCLEGESGLGRRVKAWFTYTNKKLPDTLRFITQPFNLLTDDVGELVHAIDLARISGGMIILDTLNRAAPGADENSPADMGRIISACSNLQRLIGGVILIAHHTGKDETKKLRGHSSLPAALDGAIEVTRTGHNRQWNIGKSKDDKDGDIYPFKLDVVQLGIDEDGDAITSCVVDFDSRNPANELRRAIPPKARNQKILWDAINRSLASSKEYGKGGSPTGRPCIRLEDVVSQLHGCLTCEPKRQTERIRDAITRLIGRGLLTLQEGWIWAI